MKLTWQSAEQPEEGRFVWVRATVAGAIETLPVLYVTRRLFLPSREPQETAVLFYPISADGHVGEKPNHAVRAWQYAEPTRHDVQVLITRCKVLQRLLEDANARCAAMEARLRSAGVQL